MFPDGNTYRVSQLTGYVKQKHYATTAHVSQLKSWGNKDKIDDGEPVSNESEDDRSNGSELKTTKPDSSPVTFSVGSDVDITYWDLHDSEDYNPEFPTLHCELCQQQFDNPGKWVRHVQTCHTKEQIAATNDKSCEEIDSKRSWAFGTSVAPSRVDDIVPKSLDYRIGGTGKPVIERLRQLLYLQILVQSHIVNVPGCIHNDPQTPALECLHPPHKHIHQSPGQLGIQHKSQVLSTVHPSDMLSKQLEWGQPVELSFPFEEHCCALLHVNTCPPGGQPPLQLHQVKRKLKLWTTGKMLDMTQVFLMKRADVMNNRNDSTSSDEEGTVALSSQPESQDSNYSHVIGRDCQSTLVQSMMSSEFEKDAK
uniref:C2H2-type domain-containing protein n=1 Tax=Timema tahoe TaxID=61484 RepID=A0A7R9ILX9_9NEOP|nr:unnamed protein product [Timema tahoe]